MKRYIILILAITIGLTAFSVSTSNAQSFYNFQSLQKHSLFFSISWQKKIVLGFGYSYRTSDIKYKDISFEWRAPIDQFFNGDNFEVISGVFFRHSMKRKGVGTGYHLRFKKFSFEEKTGTDLNLAFTILPGKIFAAPTNDNTGASLAGRLTYVPSLYSTIADKTGQGETISKAFAKHTLEIGLHGDLIIKRALGLAINPVIVNTFTSEDFTLPDTPSWDVQGDFYFGPTWLRQIN